MATIIFYTLVHPEIYELEIHSGLAVHVLPIPTL